MLLSSGIENLGVAFGIEVVLAFAVAVLLGYAHDVFWFRQAHSKRDTTTTDAAPAGQLPPVYPAPIPYLGTAIPFLLDCPRFLTRATSYGGKLTSVRLSFFLGRQIYFFQDRETIRSIWKQSGVLSAINIRLYAYRFLFGLPEKWLGVYRADDSGPYPKPFPGSNVPQESRIHHALHQGIHQALIGPGFAPTLQRFMRAFVARMDELGLPSPPPADSSSLGPWTKMPDIRRLFQTSMTSSFVQAIFGPNLLLLNPGFVDGLVEFDAWAPLLGKGVPRLLIPRAYAVRQSLRDQLKRWYVYARQNFREGESVLGVEDGGDGDGDPFWGSNWMRQRQKTLSRFGDDEIIASSDLGVAWASVGNLVPCALMAAVHIFEDPELLQRVRAELQTIIAEDNRNNDNDKDQNQRQHLLKKLDPKRLTNNALLSSVYAETLRLHVKTYTVVSSPAADMVFGRWLFPRNSLGLVNSGICHLDAEVWNTRGGRHPVDTFWADRFLVDPADPESGPVRPDRRDAVPAPAGEKTTTSTSEEAAGEKQPYFSMDGLDASWLPYGGGHLVCPGRFLAKSAILFVCAVLVDGFDIEFPEGPVRCGADKFGIGVEEPNRPVPFRIRKRVVVGTGVRG